MAVTEADRKSEYQINDSIHGYRDRHHCGLFCRIRLWRAGHGR